MYMRGLNVIHRDLKTTKIRRFTSNLLALDRHGTSCKIWWCWSLLKLGNVEFWQAPQACELVFINNETLIFVEHGWSWMINKNLALWYILLHCGEQYAKLSDQGLAYNQVNFTTLSRSFIPCKSWFKLLSIVIMLSNHDCTIMQIYQYLRDGCTKIGILCYMLIKRRTPGMKRSNQTSISKMLS